MKHVLSTLLLLTVTMGCLSEELLFSSTYSGELDGYNIVSTRSLILKRDGSYRFQSTAKHKIGSITETSDFKLINGDIYPLRYHYLRKIIGFKKEEFINYDWDTNKATYQRKGKPKKTYVHTLVPGMLDPSVYQLQLQRDAWLSAGVFNLGKQDYKVIKNKNLKNMPFELVKSEPLQVDGKKYQALKLQINDPASPKVTTAWLVPELNYHIGKIVHQDEDGDIYEIKLESYTASTTLFKAIYPKRSQAKHLHTQ